MGWGKNDVLAIMEFSARGIDPDDINPHQNVLTFRAWRAAGRQVAKGAISVRVTVWVARQGKETEPAPAPTDKSPVWGKGNGKTWPKTTALFHISQTIPQGAEKGTRPDAWANPALIREGTYNPLDEALDACDGELEL